MIVSAKNANTSAVILLMLIAFIVALCPTAFGQSTNARKQETREFEILINGKPAGTSATTISETENGQTIASTDAAVNLNYIIYFYQYEFHGRETWSGNLLLWVENRAVDNGKQLEVRARASSQGSVIEANDRRPRAAGPISMTTSYWHAPQGQKGDPLTLLDADQGSLHSVRIEGIVPELITAAGNKIQCTHYHLTGDMTVDLWFDAANRLIRQQTTEDGHPVELQLKRISLAARPVSRQ